jgi:hypothetical protein
MSGTKSAADFRHTGVQKISMQPSLPSHQLQFRPVMPGRSRGQKSSHRMLNLAQDVPIDYEHYPKSNIRQ